MYITVQYISTSWQLFYGYHIFLLFRSNRCLKSCSILVEDDVWVFWQLQYVLWHFYLKRWCKCDLRACKRGQCCLHVSSKHLQQIQEDLTTWRCCVIQIKYSIPLENAFIAFVTAAFIMFLWWCKHRCGFIFIHTSAFHVCIGMNTNWNWRNEVNQPNNYVVLQTCQVFMVLSMQCW